MDIGLIGLGKMGRELARRLLAAGHSLTLYNRTASATEPFRGTAKIAATPAEAARGEVVITMLADDAAVRAVWLESGLAERSEGVHLNMATVGLGISRELARRQKHYVAAPVFGRPAAAAKGELDVIAAGPKEALARCAPVFEALARQVFVVGERPEQANAVKIARNFMLATIIESLGEALALAQGSGVARATFIDILTATALGSRYASYGKMIAEQAYEPAQFSMELGLKDVDLALDTAAELGVPLPSADLIRAHLERAIAAGAGHQDWAALAEYVRGSG